MSNQSKDVRIGEILGLHDNALLSSGNQLRNHRTAVEIANHEIGMKVGSKKLLAFSVFFKKDFQAFQHLWIFTSEEMLAVICKGGMGKIRTLNPKPALHQRNLAMKILSW